MNYFPPHGLDLEKCAARRDALQWTNAKLAEEAGIGRGTVINFFNGKNVRKVTVDLIVKALGLPRASLEWKPVSEPEETSIKIEAPSSYEIVSFESPSLIAANGLGYQIVKLKSESITRRFARGKLYNLVRAIPVSINQLLEQLRRHSTVCNMLQNDPRIATLWDIRQMGENSAWWIIDEWIDGDPLSDHLDNRRVFTHAEIKSLGTEILLALKSLHNYEVIVRELAPERIILGNETRPCVLTDFEVARLVNSDISVSGKWKLINPYRAPEVTEFDAHYQSDLFSWATIMTELLTGTTDAGEEDLKTVVKTNAIVELIMNCRKSVYYYRPTNVLKVIEIWNKWKV